MKKNQVIYKDKISVNDRMIQFKVHQGIRKGREILYIRAFDEVENWEIGDVRMEQVYRKDDEKQIGQMIFRCVQKMNERYKAERGPIELCARFKALPAREKHLLCPSDWKAESTRNGALAMFQGTTAPIMEELINGAQTEEEGDRARDKVLKAVLKNQTQRGGSGAGPNYAAAMQQANVHILRANRLYENTRRRYPEWGLPPVTLKYFAFAENVVQRIAISEDGCHVYIRRRACDGVSITVPPGVKVNIEGSIPHPTTVHVHSVQEITDRDYYRRIIRQADDLYDRKRKEGVL